MGVRVCYIAETAGWFLDSISPFTQNADRVSPRKSLKLAAFFVATGYHPWFSHLISITSPAANSSDSDASLNKEEHYRNLFLSSSAPTKHSGEASSSSNDNALEIEFRTLLPFLPEPRPLSEVLAEVRENLTAFPNAMVGEVGLDRAFRVPVDYHAIPRVLTSFSIPLEHQLTVLEAQLELAVELGRNISMHSVKAQQATIDLLARMKKKHGAEKWNRISVDMHSCGLSPQTWRELEVGSWAHFQYSSVSTVYSLQSFVVLPLLTMISFDIADTFLEET